MARPRREPVRTCVGCRQEGGKRALVRVVRNASGEAVVDRTGRAPGRGAYIHPVPECIEQARRRRAVERALKAAPGEGFWAALTV